MAPLRGFQLFDIRLYRGKQGKLFLSETSRPRALIFITWHHLVDLSHVCANYTTGAKMAPPQGSHVYIGKNMEKIFLSETIRHRALVFGIQHHLANFYQVCSNYAPGAKMTTLLESHILHRLIFGKT